MKKFIRSLHHLFIPRQTNNYSAKLLHHDFLTVYLIAALVLTAGVGHIQKTKGDILGFATDVTIEKLYELTNEERAKQNVPVLEYNEDLAKAAQLKAQNMFEKDYWSHYGPAGETPSQFIL
ncbi:MAG TPA: CAP domain-containing protein, partial [Candidatus Woesebacteria bacterium]|nr:CAP domain-containing protein [Candidatus Woesebacteria bacterium]